MRLAQICNGIFAIMALSVHSAHAAAPPELADLVGIALTANPQLDALSAQVEALSHQSQQAGAWKDPMLTIAYQNVPIDSFALGRQPMSMLRIQLGQTIPMVGKTDKRENVVRQSKQAKHWQREETKTQLRAAVEKAYYQLALARQLKALTEDHITLVMQLLAAVRIRYEVGKAPQQNLLRLEVLRDRLKDDLGDFDRRDQALTASLNAVLHRPVTTAISTPKVLEIVGPAEKLERLQALAVEHRSALKQIDADRSMYQATAELAHAESTPDPTVFAAYGLRLESSAGSGGTDLVTLGVSLPISFFNEARYEERARAATSRAQAKSAQRSAAIDTINAGLASALATWTRSTNKVTTYREVLVPSAHKTLDATFSSYQVDRADFLSLFEAELELLNFEKTIRIATVDALLAETAIEQLIGKEL